MLRTDEAQRIAHGRLVELVKVVQDACGALNPDPDSSQPRNETGAYITELGAAWDQANDGLRMLAEAESPSVVETAGMLSGAHWQNS